MKNVVFLTLILALCLSCSKKQEGEQVTVQNPNLWHVIKDATMLKVTVIKDAQVPVKGTLFVTAGDIDLEKKTAHLDVDMTSWDSGLALRDGRVKSVFFETDKAGFSKAQFSVKTFGDAEVSAVKAESGQVSLNGELNFAGVTVPVTAHLTLAKTDQNKLTLTTSEPVILSIANLNHSTQLKMLGEICGHKNVEDKVSVELLAEFEQ